jgi:hypothetical protein
MKLKVIAAILVAASPALGQGVASDGLEELIQQQQIELRQRFEDGQRQRFLDQQEAAYDRRMCVRVGYRGPDIEQCVLDSAVYRRGVRPGQASQEPLFVPDPPGVNCMTFDLGNGIQQTTCD